MIGALLSSRFVRALGAALMAVAGVLTFGAMKERKGRKAGAQDVRRRAEVAAKDRKEVRDEIDSDVRGVDAVNELRENWTRD